MASTTRSFSFIPSSVHPHLHLPTHHPHPRSLAPNSPNILERPDPNLNLSATAQKNKNSSLKHFKGKETKSVRVLAVRILM
ncbi:hypothetical protein H4I95_09276 [Botrytis cinerea]